MGVTIPVMWTTLFILVTKVALARSRAWVFSNMCCSSNSERSVWPCGLDWVKISKNCFAFTSAPVVVHHSSQRYEGSVHFRPLKEDSIFVKKIVFLTQQMLSVSTSIEALPFHLWTSKTENIAVRAVFALVLIQSQPFWYVTIFVSTSIRGCFSLSRGQYLAELDLASHGKHFQECRRSRGDGSYLHTILTATYIQWPRQLVDHHGVGCLDHHRGSQLWLCYCRHIRKDDDDHVSLYRFNPHQMSSSLNKSISGRLFSNAMSESGSGLL